MFWLSAPNVNQPMAGTPDASKWKWSRKLSISTNREDAIKCADIATPTSPLKLGDTVWMHLKIIAGKSHGVVFRFVYDPEAEFVRIDAKDVVTSPKFSIHKKA